MRPRSPAPLIRALSILLARRGHIAVAFLLLLVPAIGSAAEKKDASTQPTAQSLFKGQIPFTPPTGWTENTKSRGEMLAVYVSPLRDGATSLEVLPTDAEIKAPLILMKLRMMHQSSKHVVVMEPTVEEDRRFTLRVHDKYKAGDKIADVLHLYRNLGPRVVMVTVSSLADDPEADKAIHSIGEAFVLSATYQKPVSIPKKH